MRRLNQHEHYVVGLFLLGLCFDVALAPRVHLLTTQQISLECDEVLSCQEAKPLVVIQLLELVKHFLKFATVRLKLTAAARAVHVGTFELFYLVLQLLQLSSLIFIETVLSFG